MDTNATLRSLPKTDEVLARPELAETLAATPRSVVVDSVRSAIEDARARILGGEELTYSAQDAARDAVGRATLAMKRSLHRVINATGIVVHTNLGRSVLSQAAAGAVQEVATGYSTLEYDVESGERGSRHVHVESLITQLTGAEAAMAVNNNAAAVMMILSALAHGKEVIVSRGQLVEIGGSFRVPDIMRESGATMVEVGTTNKTNLRDFEAAITDKTGLLLKVHSSNFRVVGFVEEVPSSELVELGRSRGIVVFEDQGSGVLIDLRRYGLPYEPTVGESLAAGVDVISCSGDKLLGGPQAGIIAGTTGIIGRLKKHPLARAMRLDKMTLAALETTLRAYLDEERAMRDVPTLRMLSASVAEVGDRASALASRLRDACGERASVDTMDDISRAGGGALPLADIPTVVVTVTPHSMSEVELERTLRLGEPAIIARIREGRLVLDPRTLLGAVEEDAVVAGIAHALCRQES